MHVTEVLETDNMINWKALFYSTINIVRLGNVIVNHHIDIADVTKTEFTLSDAFKRIRGNGEPEISFAVQIRIHHRVKGLPDFADLIADMVFQVRMGWCPITRKFRIDFVEGTKFLQFTLRSEEVMAEFHELKLRIS